MNIGNIFVGLVCCVIIFGIRGAIYGIIAIGISEKKGNDEGNAGFWWGFWLGLLGLVIVACQPNNKFKKEAEEEIENYDMEIDETLINNYEIEEIKKYKKLLDDGFITEEEFSEKKKQILGI
ncbi:MAG: SHOCT domain-containing protein [Ruminococcus sp.]